MPRKRGRKLYRTIEGLARDYIIHIQSSSIETDRKEMADHDEEDERVTSQQEEDGGGQAAAKTGKKRYRRDKPWDHEGIDHWKVCIDVCI